MTDRPNPEMVIVTIGPGDRLLRRICPNCLQPPRIGAEVFVSLDEGTAIHVTCVVALALVATLRPPSEVEAAARYRELRNELIDTLQDGPLNA